jgi:DNA-binding XRE family transcriptional regulator
MTGAQALPTCARCGATLSRYNPDAVCSACARPTAVPALSESRATEPWLKSNRDVATSRDDGGAMLRAWRTASGHSQAALAAMLGMTQQNLSQLESGRSPSMEQR